MASPCTIGGYLRWRGVGTPGPGQLLLWALQAPASRLLCNPQIPSSVREPPTITPTSAVSPIPHHHPSILAVQRGEGAAGPAPPPCATGSGPFGGGSSQEHTGSQVRRAGRRASRRDVVFSHSTRAGRAAAKPSVALFPTLAAIKKCKFILFLLLLFLPTCKTILGHNGPMEWWPLRAWELLGQGNTSRVGAGGTSSPNGLEAKEGQGSTQRPGEQQRLLAVLPLLSCALHPWGACRRGESLKITLENNPRPSNQPCLSSKQELVGWRREDRGFGGTRTTALLSLSRTESPSPAVLGLQCQGGQRGEDPARRGQGLREGWGCSMSGSVTWSCGSRGTALRSQSVTGKNLPGWGKAGDEESRQSSRESAVSHLAPKETCPSGEHPPRSGTPVLQAKRGAEAGQDPKQGPVLGDRVSQQRTVPLRQALGWPHSLEEFAFLR